VTDPRDWRQAARAGRFQEALRLRTVAVGEGAEPGDVDEASTLAALADVQDALRGKAWKTAARRAGEVESWPEWLDGDRVDSDVSTLTAAGAALERRDVDTALEALAALGDLPAGPFEAERLTQLGTARILDGEAEQAEACFTRALELDPQHLRALVNLGNVALETGDLDAAIQRYEAALRIDDAFANAHHNLGVAYRKRGQIGRSVAALRRAQRAERGRNAREAREDVRAWREQAGARWIPRLLWAAVGAALLWWVLSR